MSSTNTTTATLPKFLKVDATALDKATIQNLRRRFDATEKQVVTALLKVAAEHDAQLLQHISGIKSEKTKE